MSYTIESALQHGKFLADCAESYMESVNKYAEAKDEYTEALDVGDLNDDHREKLEWAEAAMAEYWSHLQSAIYEFRKRASDIDD